MSPNFKAALGAILLLIILGLANFWNVANAATGPSASDFGLIGIGILVGVGLLYLGLRKSGRLTTKSGTKGSGGGGGGGPVPK